MRWQRTVALNMNAHVRRTLVQGLLGLLVTVVGFIAGTMVCEGVGGIGIKYIDELGQLYVGLTIFALTLILAAVCRFETVSLFATAALVVGFIFVAGTALSLTHGARISLAGLMGMISDTCFVSRHTALPVLCAAVVYFLLRRVFSLLVGCSGTRSSQTKGRGRPERRGCKFD